MLFFIITACLFWWVTLINFVLLDYRLLLKTTRAATTLYLVILGLFIPEVLREGLSVLGLNELQDGFRLLWMSWFSLVVIGTVYWMWLIPAALIAVVVLSIPDVGILLKYGLVQKGWLEIAYTPIWFVVSNAYRVFLGGPFKSQYLQALRESGFGSVMNATTAFLDKAPQHFPWLAPVSQRLREIQRS
ncbi:hypothetical protein F5Y05DRAFT_202379 [Hypoxylon sp. FL0543]|nr:hypothetical protein F5Y05DRAFT_202379 [Hypoxylon sp. FL0543]